MKIILDIIQAAILEIHEKRIVFILDGYSCDYDHENEINKIKKLVYENKNFFLEIVYDIKTSKDAENLYKNLDPKHHINYNTDDVEKYFYFGKLKLLSEMRKYFNKNEIPAKYKETFGENASYFFEYKNLKKTKKIKFKEFVQQKKAEIKNEILYFCGDSKCKLYFNEINRYIESNNKFFYDDIIQYIPANYIEINIEPKPDPAHYGEDFDKDILPKYYSLNYSFPLVKDIMREIAMEKGSIDMKNPEFLKLPGSVLGSNFDVEMNKIFLKLIDGSNFFEHTDKIKIFVDNIMEKNEKNTPLIFQNKDVILKFNNNLFRHKINYDKINFNNYTCIVVFQNEFCGKAFDILFFTKKKLDNRF